MKAFVWNGRLVPSNKALGRTSLFADPSPIILSPFQPNVAGMEMTRLLKGRGKDRFDDVELRGGNV